MFLTRGNSQYAILNSIVYIPGCPVTISGSLSYHRIAYVENLKGRMNSRSAALAALAAASALLAYIVFRKREVCIFRNVDDFCLDSTLPVSADKGEGGGGGRGGGGYQS